MTHPASRVKKSFFKTYSTPYHRQRLFGRGRIVRRTVVKELSYYKGHAFDEGKCGVKNSKDL